MELRNEIVLINLIMVEKKLKFTAMKTYKNDGRLTTNAVKAVKKVVIDKVTGKIYPCQWKGRGRTWNLIDNLGYIEDILKNEGFKYHIGNDAVRGGKEGTYIKTTDEGLNFLLEIQKFNM